jgi:hypothetical protein
MLAINGEDEADDVEGELQVGGGGCGLFDYLLSCYELGAESRVDCDGELSWAKEAGLSEDELDDRMVSRQRSAEER